MSGRVASVGLSALLVLVAPATATAACPPSTTILKSPRAGSHEVQAKGLNDRGDVVGFSDGRDGTFRAILWKRGKAARAVKLGVLPGYVSSEAYGVNNHRVVFGLLYDKRERTFPFRWKDGRMTVLRGPNGRIQQADVPDRNAINERGEITGTLIVAGNRRAVRWTRKGKATFLPRCRDTPGRMRGASARTASYPVGRAGCPTTTARTTRSSGPDPARPFPLNTPPGRADGAAEATNRSGLTVGYLGNLGTDTDPESDQAAVWRTRDAAPLLLGPADPYAYGELVDVNDRGQAAGMSGTFTESLFPVVTARDLEARMAEPAQHRDPRQGPSRPPRRGRPAPRHQRSRDHRRQRLRPRGQGLRRAASHLPRPLDVRLRTVGEAWCRSRRPAERAAGADPEDVPARLFGPPDLGVFAIFDTSGPERSSVGGLLALRPERLAQVRMPPTAQPAPRGERRGPTGF